MASTSNSTDPAAGGGHLAHDADRFPVRTFTTMDPTYVHPARDAHRRTCQVWTLHLDTGAGGVEQVRALGRRLALLPAVRDYVGGDDFTAWAEPFPPAPTDGGAGRGLHVYLAAPSAAAAVAQARVVCLRTHQPAHLTALGAVLSTGADWAEQVPLWPLDVEADPGALGPVPGASDVLQRRDGVSGQEA